MRVILDTNALFSAIIIGSQRMSEVVSWICEHHEAAISEYVANEIIEKASEKRPQSLSAVVEALASGKFILLEDAVPERMDRPIVRDPDDQAILDAAIAHDVDLLISGDGDFLALNLQRPRIMTATQFREEFMPENE